MLMNILEGNLASRIFHEKQGAYYVQSILEKNERAGIVFDVPCALYVKDLKSGPS